MPSVESIISKKVIITDGCWIWNASKSSNGYSKILFNRKHTSGHKVIYEHFKGSVPVGMEIDHLCRNRLCVNPNHLEAVTQRENNLRGFGPAAVNYRRVKCKSGHQLSGENLYLTPSGRRQCRECRTASCRKYKNKKLKEASFATSSSH